MVAMDSRINYKNKIYPGEILQIDSENVTINGKFKWLCKDVPEYLIGHIVLKTEPRVPSDNRGKQCVSLKKRLIKITIVERKYLTKSVHLIRDFV